MLPKCDTPLITVELPSSKRKIKLRLMKTKEEKILLMAKESSQDGDILPAVQQVINNCLKEKIDIDTFSLFDIEWIFVQLISASVNNISEVSYQDNEDKKQYKFKIDLTQVKIIFPEVNEKEIAINSKMGITLKYPNGNIVEELKKTTTELESLDVLIVDCIEKIFDGEKIYTPKDYTKEELIEFIDNLDIKVYRKIQQFLENLPKLNYVIEYKNSLGNDRKIVLENLRDFFSF